MQSQKRANFTSNYWTNNKENNVRGGGTLTVSPPKKIKLPKIVTQRNDSQKGKPVPVLRLADIKEWTLKNHKSNTTVVSPVLTPSKKMNQNWRQEVVSCSP